MDLASFSDDDFQEWLPKVSLSVQQVAPSGLISPPAGIASAVTHPSLSLAQNPVVSAPAGPAAPPVRLLDQIGSKISSWLNNNDGASTTLGQAAASAPPARTATGASAFAPPATGKTSVPSQPSNGAAASGGKRDLASLLASSTNPFLLGATPASLPSNSPFAMGIATASIHAASSGNTGGAQASKRTRGNAAAASAGPVEEDTATGARKRRKIEPEEDDKAESAPAASAHTAAVHNHGNKGNNNRGSSASADTNAVKQAQLKELQKRVDELTKQNDVLQAQVKALSVAVQPDPLAREPERKKQLAEILALAKNPATADLQLRAAILSYKNEHADYGKTRWNALRLHLKCLKQLLAPTQLTRLVLWTLAQENAAEAASYSSSGGPALPSFSHATWESLADQCGHGGPESPILQNTEYLTRPAAFLPCRTISRDLLRVYSNYLGPFRARSNATAKRQTTVMEVNHEVLYRHLAHT
jgi:hypothetical protein